MADSKNVQDVFLNHIRKNKISVTIFLVNGVKLTGIVTCLITFLCCCAATRTYSWFTSTQSPPSCPHSR